jgi:leucyl-tRNA synthetase
MLWPAFSHRCQARGNVSDVTNPSHADVPVCSLALAEDKVKAAIEGKEIVKVLVVKGRLVNIVVK